MHNIAILINLSEYLSYDKQALQIFTFCNACYEEGYVAIKKDRLFQIKRFLLKARLHVFGFVQQIMV